MAEFWRVNGYGYPNPFGKGTARQVRNAQLAWDILLAFTQFRGYGEVEQHFAGKLSANTVESRKPAFEQFGLIVVPARSGEVRVTPAGRQFIAAGEAGRADELEWIGLNLLLRYPLRGIPGRPSHGAAQDGSDLLLYWFVLAAALDLGGVLWWPGVTRVLCTVFRTEDASGAVERVRQIRRDGITPAGLPLPAATEEGGLYNSIHQVVVAMGLNYALIDRVPRQEVPYGEGWGHQTRCSLRTRGADLIARAMGGAVDECGDEPATWTDRMPRAPGPFGSEEEHFEYLGREVDDEPSGAAVDRPPRTLLGGHSAWVLRQPGDVAAVDATRVRGPIRVLCAVTEGERVVLDSDQETSYIVARKAREGQDVVLTLRPGKPILSWAPIAAILEGDDGGD